MCASTLNDITKVHVLRLGLSLRLLLSLIKSLLLADEEVFFILLRQVELANCLAIVQGVLILLLFYQLDRPFVEEELILDMVLEAHDNVVPNGTEPALI